MPTHHRRISVIVPGHHCRACGSHSRLPATPALLYLDAGHVLPHRVSLLRGPRRRRLRLSVRQTTRATMGSTGDDHLLLHLQSVLRRRDHRLLPVPVHLHKEFRAPVQCPDLWDGVLRGRGIRRCPAGDA